MMRGYWLGALACGFGLLFASTQALAETTQPDGKKVPIDSSDPALPSPNSEDQLSDLFLARSEAIDFIADGFPTPDTFSPLCGFKATFVLHQAANKYALGWYNVVAGATLPPADAEIYEIVPSSAAVGQTFAGSDIIADTHYKGGLIGFALKTSPPHFTERKFNQYCTATACASATDQHWILSISYRSKVNPNGYYLAFEDGDTSASSFGNDGDYNDDVFFLEGLACAGDGETCSVEGAKGVCKDGIQVCNNTGELVCNPLTQASDEQCNGLDDDCDGEIDGKGLCEVGEICNRGVCVPYCGVGEFVCTHEPYTVCESGICVEPECAGKTCKEGEICIKGECREACKDVTCPVGQECRFGTCVDPCAGVTCELPRVCIGGACVLGCDCKPCGADESCQDTGLCLDQDCVGKTCGTGEFCADDGMCTDACQGAMCPGGSTCEMGACVPLPPAPDGPGDGDGTGDGDGDETGDGDGDGTVSIDAGATAGSDAGAGPGGAADNGVSDSDSGCSCSVPFGHEARPRALAFAALFVLGFALRRRRR